MFSHLNYCVVASQPPPPPPPPSPLPLPPQATTPTIMAIFCSVVLFCFFSHPRISFFTSIEGVCDCEWVRLLNQNASGARTTKKKWIGEASQKRHREKSIMCVRPGINTLLMEIFRSIFNCFFSFARHGRCAGILHSHFSHFVSLLLLFVCLRLFISLNGVLKRFDTVNT